MTPAAVSTPAVNITPLPSMQVPPAEYGTSTGPSKAAKKAAKKARAREKQKDSGDELDKALAELSVK